MSSEPSAGKAAAKVESTDKKKNYWTLDKVASAIAISTFMFGVGSFAQARDLFTGTTQLKLEQQQAQQLAAQQIKTEQQKIRQSKIDDYIAHADEACRPAVSQDTNRPTTYDYQAQVRIGALRQQMLTDWKAAPLYLLPADAMPSVNKILSELQAANDFWVAMSAAFSTGNLGVEDSALGQFTLAEGAFETDAAQFGFQVCDHAWPNLQP
jgi:hypothetical protein